MISLSFYLSWPWFKQSKKLSKCYFYKYWSITKYKTLEIQFNRGGNTIVGGSFRWDANCDHAGVMFDIELYRRFLHISICDNRHWNHDENRYVNYDNPKEVEKYW
jgi:hypothetical protein